MKLTKLALVTGISLAACYAHAEVTLSPMIGYHFFDNGSNEAALEDAAEVSVALGYRTTPHVGYELRYGMANPKLAAPFSGKSRYKALTADAYYRFRPYEDFQPYVLAGIGMASHKGNGNNTGTVILPPGGGAIAIDGCEISFAGVPGTGALEKNCPKGSNFLINGAVGAFVNVTENLALRGELRAIHEFDRGNIDALLSVGALYSFGVAKPDTPPVVDGDDDQDGVLNSRDKCPGTPRNLVVDENGCPLTRVETISRELKVLFDTDKDFIKPQFFGEIEGVAALMREHPQATVEIQGHTDSSGSAIRNEGLSQRRAESVANVLINKYGIARSRVSAKGYGSSQPVADNSTVEGRAKNRRTVAATSIQVRVMITK